MIYERMTALAKQNPGENTNINSPVRDWGHGWGMGGGWVGPQEADGLEGSKSLELHFLLLKNIYRKPPYILPELSLHPSYRPIGTHHHHHLFFKDLLYESQSVCTTVHTV